MIIAKRLESISEKIGSHLYISMKILLYFFPDLKKFLKKAKPLTLTFKLFFQKRPYLDQSPISQEFVHIFRYKIPTSITVLSIKVI